MKKIYFIAAAALLMAGCDRSDDAQPASPVALQVSATIGESSLTRARDSSWDKDDCIGITAIVGNEEAPYVNSFINHKYTTDGDNKFNGKTIYYYNPMVISAYYPFMGVEGTEPGNISANTLAANQTSDKQPLIDFLFAEGVLNIEGSKGPEINFNFSHKMSKITLIFENADDNTVDDNTVDDKPVDRNPADVSKIRSYRIDGLKMAGKFNTAKGDCEADADADSESLVINLSEVPESGEAVPSLILFPQEFGDNEVKLTISSDELKNKDYLQNYSCILKFQGNMLESGNNYQFTIKVTKTGISVNQSTINPWNTIVHDEDLPAVSSD